MDLAVLQIGGNIIHVWVDVKKLQKYLCRDFSVFYAMLLSPRYNTKLLEQKSDQRLLKL